MGLPPVVCLKFILDPKHIQEGDYLKVKHEKIHPAFLGTVLNTSFIRNSFLREVHSSAGNYNINTRNIAKQVIPLPSLDEQEELLTKWEYYKLAGNALENHIDTSTRLKSSLLCSFLDVQSTLSTPAHGGKE